MKDYPVKILDAPHQHTLSMRFQVEPEQLGNRLREVLPQVFHHALNQGLSPSLPYVRHFGMIDGKLDLEGGVAVAQEPTGDGAFIAGALPAGKVAMTVHQGPYDGLPQARQRLVEWLERQGHTPSGAPWEIYITDPGENIDPSRWKAQIYQPLAAS